LKQDEVLRAAFELTERDFVERHRHPFLIEFAIEPGSATGTDLLATRAQRLPRDSTISLRPTPANMYGRLYELVQKRADDILVGRSPLADVRIDDERVSTKHAKLQRGRGAWLVTDLRSTNGTTLNGRPVPYGVPLPLRSGSIVGFGVLSFKFLEAVDLHRLLRAGGADTPSTPLRPPEPAPDPGALAALELVVRCEPLSSVLLPLDREISVGRAEGNDVVLPHSAVSRHHATLTRKGNVVLVRDLGSPNPVRIGMAEIRREGFAAPHGPPIVIGPFELRVEVGIVDETGRLQLLDANATDSIAGSLEVTPLVEILQAVEATARSGALRIRCGELAGEIVFAEGAPHRARLGLLTGADAVQQMLALPGGTFVLWPTTEPPPGDREIAVSFSKIAIDARHALGVSSSPVPARTVERADTPLDILADSVLMRQGAVQLVRLVKLATDLVRARDHDVLLRTIAEGLTRLLSAKRTTIYVFDQASRTLSSRATDRLEVVDERIRLGEGAVGAAAQGRKLVARGAESLAAPMSDGKGELLGVIEVAGKGEPFTANDEQLLGMFAGYTGSAIENALLSEEVLRRERLAAVGWFAGTVVHDVRNVLSLLNLYLDGLAPPGRGSDDRELIRGEIDKIVDLTTEVLEFARGAPPALKLRREDVDVALEPVIRVLRSELERSGLVLDFAPGGAGHAELDAARLGRVLVNLAHNARKVLPTGGRLTVRTCRRGARAVIEVEDDGPGLPAEMEGRIFAPFASAGEQGGTGLGLAIAKSIVDAHGGTISARAAKPTGTLFEIALSGGDS
jgi:signal transduction histidine kinase/pSer/pThr/pTyr-binding forkhead associated (FHA) protein